MLEVGTRGLEVQHAMFLKGVQHLGAIGLARVLGLAFVTQGMATVVAQLSVPAANR